MSISTKLSTSQAAAPGSTTPSYALYLTEPGDTNAISPDDINQAGIGDCYFDATMAELAIQDPSLITNMITNDGNGTYTVKLYNLETGAPAPQTVTVAGISAEAVNAYTTEDVVNGQKEIWLQIIEEAYGQADGGYAAIGNGGWPSYAMSQLTGNLTYTNYRTRV